MKVAIIGAGISGIYAAKCLKYYAPNVEIVGYERYGYFGGLWNVPEEVDEGQELPTAMYSSMVTNVPTPLLSCLPELDLYHPETSYPSWRHVNKQFNCLVEKSGIKDFFNLMTRVDNIKENLGKFELMSTNLKSREKNEMEIFDKVIVCCGAQHVPNMIEIPGSETFSGKFIHSKYFQNPEEVSGKRVLIIGASFSALDASLQCVKANARSIRIATRDPRALLEKVQWVNNVKQIAVMPQKISGSKVIFQDESEEEFDMIIAATGYKVKMDFLDDSLKFTTKENAQLQPDNLYKQCINVKNPNVFFLGMQVPLLPFEMARILGTYIAKVISGKILLPTKEEMMEQIEGEQQKVLGLPKSMRSFYTYAFEFMKKLDREIDGEFIRSDKKLRIILNVLDDINEDCLNYRSKLFYK